MARKIRSAADIRQIIQERFNSIDVVKEDKAEVTIHEVQWHEPDETGCNWGLGSYRGDRHYADAIARIVHELQQQYNLPDQ